MMHVPPLHPHRVQQAEARASYTDSDAVTFKATSLKKAVTLLSSCLTLCTNLLWSFEIERKMDDRDEYGESKTEDASVFSAEARGGGSPAFFSSGGSGGRTPPHLHRHTPPLALAGIMRSTTTSFDATKADLENTFNKGLYPILRQKLAQAVTQYRLSGEAFLFRDMATLAMGRSPASISPHLREYIRRQKESPSHALSHVAWAYLWLVEAKTKAEKEEGLAELRALAAESSAASFLLGSLYAQGHDILEKHHETAITYLAQGAETHAACAFRLADLYLNDIPSFPHAKQRGAAALKQAATLGHPTAQFNYANVLTNNGDKKAGLAMLRKSAAASHVNATHNLGMYYLRHHRYYEGLFYATRAYQLAHQQAQHAPSLSLDDKADPGPPLKRLKVMSGIYQKFLDKKKPLSAFLPFGQSEEDDNIVLKLLNIFLESPAPIEQRQQLLLLVLQELKTLTPQLKREIYKYLEAENLGIAFKEEAYSRLLSNIALITQDAPFGKRLWELYHHFVELYYADDAANILREAMRKSWPKYAARDLKDFSAGLLERVLQQPQVWHVDFVAPIVRLLETEDSLDWKIQTQAYQLQQLLMEEERFRPGAAPVIKVCQNILLRQTEPYKLFPNAQHKRWGRDILDRCRRLGKEEVGLLYLNRLHNLPPESPLRDYFLKRALECPSSMFNAILQELVMCLTALQEPIAFPKLAEGEGETASRLEGYELVKTMLADPRIKLLNKQDFESAPSVTPAEYAEAVDRICSLFNELLSEGAITEDMRRTESGAIGGRTQLRKLITQEGNGGPIFRNQVVALSHYLTTRDATTNAALLGSWAAAGYFCSTRSNEEIREAYRQYAETLGGMAQGIGYEVAKILAQQRRRLLYAIVPDTMGEPIHQRKHLAKRMFEKLGLYGQDDSFRDQYIGVVKDQYRTPGSSGYLTDEDLETRVLNGYTVCSVVDKVYNALKEGHIAYSVVDDEITSPHPRKHELYETIEGMQDLMDMDEETYIPVFTKRSALSILIALGYIKQKPRA